MHVHTLDTCGNKFHAQKTEDKNTTFMSGSSGKQQTCSTYPPAMLQSGALALRHQLISAVVLTVWK